MTQRTKRKSKRDIYQEVTDKIIGHLEQGTAPWRNPIRRGIGDGWPKNLDSGKRYRGINVFLLGLTSWERGYSSDFWMTFKQASAAGGQVRKGEKGSLVTFWKMYVTKDRETGLDVEIPMLKHYTAFNLDQIDGIEAPDAPEPLSDNNPFEPIKAAERIVEGYISKPTIAHDGGGRAFYRPSTDTIHMPEQGRFENPESYYSTLFHEIAHSTGHSKRLDRGLDTKLAPFGSNDYSKEELVAEMGAAFLSASAGISPPTIEQSASYLQSWINVLRGDKRLVVTAAASAQKAADLVLGTTFETASTPTQKIAASQPRIDDSKQPVDKPADPTPTQLDLF
ncbi:ArdC family protein [Rhodopirellula bahusiensis]|uniref:Antirestriction protein ArdC n=1 Tax=Rhodopirellula bahusiensis TaxID=2014065 RepID=A0A2G1W264_9BACT|nr:zincin-like metallopeptidase domain-containing protein [Rhodopirellula bahusiensis]PHQ33137.1 antirestriction protein ArdC [Rhodopirellula bahusiensis]